MKSTPHHLRIGTMAGCGRHTAAYIRDILPHGFECFQILLSRTLHEVDLPKLAEELRHDLDPADVIVSSLAIFGNPLGDTEEDALTRRAFEQAIDHAHLFGCDLVCGFTGRVPGRHVRDSLPRLKEVWTPLLERAAAHGVRIAYENCPMGNGTWNVGDRNIAINPDAWELIFETLPFPNLGLEWEPCHQLAQLIDPLPQLRQWLPRIFHVHGKDATIDRDLLARHGISGAKKFVAHRTPGFGDTNWTDVISILRAGGYRGTIDIEGWHDPVYRDELEMTGQVHGLNYLKRCRGGDFVPNPVLPAD